MIEKRCRAKRGSSKVYKKITENRSRVAEEQGGCDDNDPTVGADKQKK